MGNEAKRKKVSLIFLFLLIFLLLLLCTASCNTTEPPDPPVPPEPILKLELEDVSCTEAWIQLTTNNLQLPATLNLLKDHTITKTINLQTADTLLYIDSLLPNTSYLYQASHIVAGSIQQQVSSNELIVTTMDTTSHDFTFQTWTFGTIGSSSLYDVAIISENNIWCVGEIMVADSSPNGYTTYNAVHWDGNHWELMRIRYFGSCSAVEYPALRAIWAFSENNIVVTNGGSIGWYDGNTIILDCGANPLLNGAVRKIWGSSNNDLYIVGNNGSIAHYNGTAWKKIASGTDLNINDIWGDYNEKTGEWEILAVCGNILQGSQSDRGILSINSTQAVQLNSEGSSWPLRTIWFKSARRYYVAGSGVYEKQNLFQSIWKNDIYDISTYSINRLRGKSINSVAATGGVGELVYFNGLRWQSYIQETALQSGNFLGLDIKDDLIIAVGQNSPQAVITIGRRN